MHTSRFQIGLIAVLATGLGLSFLPSDAVGYPAGPTVSLGSNPLVSISGYGTDTTLVTADSGDLIITDVVFGSRYGSWMTATLTLSDGSMLANFGTPQLSPNGLAHQFSSGLRVPTGQTLTLSLDGDYSDSQYRYTITGYYAQP